MRDQRCTAVVGLAAYRPASSRPGASGRTPGDTRPPGRSAEPSSVQARSAHPVVRAPGCFRVETNVDLRSLRFNGTVYRRTDLESRVTVPERNALIVDTYCANVKGRRAVTFCVSVAHAEEIARRFREAGVQAVAVSGKVERDERRRLLEEYRRGEILVLCTFDVLNEGWVQQRWQREELKADDREDFASLERRR